MATDDRLLTALVNYLGAIEADVGYTSDPQRINQVMVEEYLAGIERALVLLVVAQFDHIHPDLRELFTIRLSETEARRQLIRELREQLLPTATSAEEQLKKRPALLRARLSPEAE